MAITYADLSLPIRSCIVVIDPVTGFPERGPAVLVGQVIVDAVAVDGEEGEPASERVEAVAEEVGRPASRLMEPGPKPSGMTCDDQTQ